MSERVTKDLDVRLDFNSDHEMSSDDLGYVEAESDDRPIREFIVVIKSDLSRKYTLTAIAHEMVHVKQYATGELLVLHRPSGYVRWKNGKHYDDSKKYNFNDPWEREAYSSMDKLYEKYESYRKENRRRKKR